MREHSKEAKENDTPRGFTLHTDGKPMSKPSKNKPIIAAREDISSSRKGRRGRMAESGALAAIAQDTVERHGSAVKEHLVVHGGVDNETGRHLKKSIKSVSQSKVHPKFQKQNLKQQAGIAAELKEVARRRAERAIAGKKPTAVRTDDIPGHQNDPLFDITDKVDAAGNPVPGSSAQMKFVGNNPKEAVNALMGKRYEKYLDSGGKMLVPSDHYEGMQEELAKREAALERQVAKLKSEGKTAQAKTKQAQIAKCRKWRKTLEKSSVSNKEAMEARTNPGLSTAKDVAKIAHRAGTEQAKMGVVAGGGLSLVRNFWAVCQGKKEVGDAVKDVGCDTAEAAAASYAAGAGGALVKGGLQNAGKETLRALSKTNLPAYIAVGALECGKTLGRFARGEIGGAECLDELGQKGYGMVNGVLFSAMGQAAIPIPVVGALAGFWVGNALSALSYNILRDSLKEAALARKERIRIERECKETIAMLQQVRSAMEETAQRYFETDRKVFDEAYERLREGLAADGVDADMCIAAANSITRVHGGRPQFENMEEFDAWMASDAVLVL